MKLLTKHDANNINKSNTFSIDTVSMKINLHENLTQMQEMLHLVLL